MLPVGLRLFVAFLLTAIVTDGQQFDYKFYPDTKGWFKLHLVPANWAEARLKCQLEDAVLASPLNANLLKAMKEVMGDKVHSGVFTGIHANISQPDYFSEEGVPLSEMHVTWAPNELDTFVESEGCLIMRADGSLSHVKCTEIFPYICYKSDVSCGTDDKEYVLDTRTGSCYKFHRVGQTWSRASMTCAAEGGYLVVINSEVESQLLNELFAKFPNSAIITKEPMIWSLYIGFQDWGELGTWRTIHGETLQAAGFDKWNPGEPNNVNNEEHCGSILRTGLLNDVSCNLDLPFVCEKYPISSKHCIISDRHIWR